MKYRNNITGAVIDVNSRISGKHWKPMKAERKEAPSAAPAAEKKATARRKTTRTRKT